MKLTAKQYAEILVNVVSKADKTAAERFSESFWMLLRENRQERLFGSIMRHAKHIFDSRCGVVEVSATFAGNPSPEVRDALIAGLEKILEKKIRLMTSVDSDIKGGVILQIDDSRYDASVAGRLRHLAQTLQS
jgi:ATP synthase F1 delta subunit